GRFRFGLTPLIPQILESMGVSGALHLRFGPGDVPPDGSSRVRWAGAGGEIAAHAREPLPARTATAFWTLPDVLADAYESEQTVSVTLARWPGHDCPFLDDLKALTALSPALGEFATYSEVFAQDDPFARVYAADPRKYRSPGLSKVGQAESAVIRTDAAERRDGLFAGLCELLGAPAADGSPAERLAGAIATGGDQPGTLWLNPLPVPRLVGATCGEGGETSAPPADHPAIKQVGAKSFTFEIPPGGFVWFPDQPARKAPQTKAKAKTAEAGVVRNERFEVLFDPATAGIAAVKNYGRSPVRLGLRPAVRFHAPRTLPKETEHYSRAVAAESEPFTVIDAGPARGEALSRGVLIDPAGGARLGRFELRVRLNRGARTAEIDVSLFETGPALEAGELVLRWAWDDETAELARSIQGSRQAAPREGAFEATHY
ncbi:MAG: hypothetical protein AAF907_15010, partial [Planctomycetota bacterium]